MKALNLFTTSHCSLRRAATVLLFFGLLLIALVSCKPESNPDDDRRVSNVIVNDL